MNPSADDRTCVHHDGAPALAICAECGGDICGACHAADERGYAVCPPCRGEPPSTAPDWERSGRRFRPAAYVSTLWRLVREPRTFFREFSAEGPWIPACTFGFLSALFGILVGRILELAVDPSFLESLEEYAAARSLPTDDLELFVLGTSPVSALLVVGVHVAVLRVAARVGGAEMSWRTAVRIGGYALGVAVFLALPPVYDFEIGGLLAVFWLFNLEASALRHLYDMSPWRATFVVLVPVLAALMCAG